MIDRDPGSPGRNPLLIVGGFMLLGVAVAFLLFGNSLFARPQRPQVSLPLDGPSSDNAGRELNSGAAGTGDRVLAPDTGTLSVGDIAPNFVLANLEGEAVRLTDFRGQPVIVNFWATWCPPCRIEMPDLQAAYERYDGEDLAILALNQSEPAILVRDYFYEEMGLTFTPLIDEVGLVSDRYGIFSFPTSLFLDETGTIFAVHRGLMTGEQLDGYMAELLAN
jgi:peroxiredoxin